VLTFIVIASLFFMIISIMLGQRLAQTRVSPKALLSYFALFGFIAPLWLIKAAWGNARAREATWR
jgi:hypothetical protein